MAYKKREYSGVSSQDYSTPHKEQPFNDEDEQYDREVCKRIRSAQSTLEAIQKATKEQLPDSSVRTNILNERLLESGNYVERMAIEPAMSEEYGDMSL